MKNYILRGKIPVPVNDILEWARQFKKQDCRVAKHTTGETTVSTVFLGLDHQFGKGKPLLFETMVFGGKLDGEQDRYHTWEEAEAGHKNMVEKVNESEAGHDSR